MKILVTGANGFVGAHLVEHLAVVGHDVVEAVRRPGTAALRGREVVVGTVGRSTDWSQALTGCDAVVHLAARVHVMNDTSPDPAEDFRETNARGTRRLAQACVRAGVPRLVFLSSVKVNGEATAGRPFSVDDAPAPVDPYGVSKAEAEQLLRAETHGTATTPVVVRTPLVYGPGVGGNVATCLRLVSRGVPLPLALVRNSRRMMSVTGLARLLERAATDPAAAGALVMAADEAPVSTPDLLRHLAAGMGRRSLLLPVPVAALRLGARALGATAVVDRLTGSLDVRPGSTASSFDWRSGSDPETDLRATGRWFADQGTRR